MNAPSVYIIYNFPISLKLLSFTESKFFLWWISIILFLQHIDLKYLLGIHVFLENVIFAGLLFNSSIYHQHFTMQILYSIAYILLQFLFWIVLCFRNFYYITNHVFIINLENIFNIIKIKLCFRQKSQILCLYILSEISTNSFLNFCFLYQKNIYVLFHIFYRIISKLFIT